MQNPNAVAGHKRAIEQLGEEVTFQRISGQAPRSATFSAVVCAIVRQVTPDTTQPSRAGYSARQPGSLTQNDRKVVVLAADLAAKRFPLPVEKNDRIVIASTGEVLNITEVDAYKRQIAGAIEITAAGVS